ncbi:MAG: outer membrane beta-barrel protein, partial [Rhodospirillaceae bacterium]
NNYQGNNRQEGIMQGSMGTAYLLNHNVRAGIDYTHKKKDATPSSSSFDQRITMLRLRGAM